MKRPIMTACLLLLAQALTLVVVAETPAQTADDERARALTEKIRAEEDLAATRVVLPYRIALSHPQALSARLGALWSRQPTAFECTATCDYVGPLFQVDAGTGSAQLSAGYARVIAGQRRGGPLLSDVYVGFGVKGALLRTFGNTTRRYRDQTYVGLEGEFTITNLNFTVGAFRRVSDDATADRWLTVFGFGWGF